VPTSVQRAWLSAPHLGASCVVDNKFSLTMLLNNRHLPGNCCWSEVTWIHLLSDCVHVWVCHATFGL
jgi:hypothetical protein